MTSQPHRVTETNNIPQSPNPLVGRESELVALGGLLTRPDVRLVTLTGPGGTGKTRLAVAAAEKLLSTFRDGVYFVSLAALTDPKLVASTIAQNLSLQEVKGQTLLETLLITVQERQILLMLDNFEQVLPAAQLLKELLANSAQLKILVASQAVLHLSGEHEFPLSPLALPNLKQLPPLEQLAGYEAIELFEQRAQAARPGFRLTETNSASVAEICVRLDGLPLALELAAARCKLFSPQELLAQLKLTNRFNFLVGGPLDAPERHKKLRNALDWSYDLLNEAEKQLFSRLGVFAGGCTLETITAVLENNNFSATVLELVGSLVDKSLVRRLENSAGQSRFVMLETLREYALEKLAKREEATEIAHQHAQYFRWLAEEAETGLRTEQQSYWLERLEVEHDNLRHALTWAISAKSPGEIGLRLGGALWLFWFIRGYLTEGRKWLEQLLALEIAETPITLTARAKALSGAGNLALAQGDTTISRTFHENALALRQQLGSKLEVALSLNNLGTVEIEQGNTGRAVKLLEESYRLAKEADNQGLAGRTLNNLGLLALQQRNFERAATYLQESLAIFRQLGDNRAVSLLLNNLGEVSQHQGDYLKAKTLHLESQLLRQQLGDRAGVAYSYNNLGFGAQCQGQLAEAETLLQQSLALFQELGDKRGLATVLSNLGLVAYRQGQNSLAEELSQRAFKLRQGLADKSGLGHSLNNLGHIYLAMQNFVQAENFFHQGFGLFHETGDKLGLAQNLEGLAELGWKKKQPEQAVGLLALAQTQREAMGTPLAPVEHPSIEKLLQACRTNLGESAFNNAWNKGRSLRLDETLNTILARLTTPPKTSPSSKGGLTTRQLEVLRLVAQGLTNAQIAESLCLSQLTVNSYLRAIYDKLGVSSRSAATRYVIENKLV